VRTAREECFRVWRLDVSRQWRPAAMAEPEIERDRTPGDPLVPRLAANAPEGCSLPLVLDPARITIIFLC
jgi:hypothetical protein